MATQKVSIIEMDLNTVKDSMWRLTNRVYILENFIKEKFGNVLFCIDASITENISVIKQGNTLGSETIDCSPANCKNKRAKHTANAIVTSDEDVDIGDKDSTSDNVLLNSEIPVLPVKENQRLTAKVGTSPKQKARRKSPRNLANEKADIFTGESTKLKRNVAEDATSDIDIKEEYDYLSDDSNEAEGKSDNDPDFIINEHSMDIDPDYAENAVRKRKRQLWKKISSVSEDILQRDWRRKNGNSLPDRTVVYYYCKEGGKACPVLLKRETIPDLAIYFYTNGREHCHNAVSRKSGLTYEQKNVVQELLKENTKIRSYFIFKVFESRSLEVPSKSQLRSYLQYARRKTNATHNLETVTPQP